ncbi:hypothetical protein [Clostridium transplantifaecale]|uniref:hypothetical protein n=1 Tax=Clostridium transplantifaecale TaxID=2479838 RepID=UPI000F644E0E|nr:hypothetical protein [Clostridium transplantifaecale]
MPKQKKKQPRPERREARLKKARAWVPTYAGSHLVRAYRKKFGVDPACALRDLGEIGAIPPEKLAVMQRSEQLRQEAARRKREERKQQAVYDRYPDSDDTFFFIAGYTPGGAPYGVTWEEMGMEPWGGLDGDSE